MDILTGIILIVFGLISCFFGLRFYRIVLALLGFAAGYFTASSALATQGGLVQLAGAIVVGLVLASLFYQLYRLGYVLLGALLGAVLAVLINAAFNLQGAVSTILIVVLLVIGGILGQVFANPIIRISTAFSGAGQAISGLAALATGLHIALPLSNATPGAGSTSPAGLISLVATIILGVVGYIYQARHNQEPI